MQVDKIQSIFYTQPVEILTGPAGIWAYVRIYTANTIVPAVQISRSCKNGLHPVRRSSRIYSGLFYGDGTF